jgi:pyrroline-5-carboxylate reductase
MKVSIIGCGNMMSAITLRISSCFDDISFYTFTPSYTSALSLANDLNGEAVEDLKNLPESEVYFIGCKPQQGRELSKNIDLKDKYIVSILAGTSTEQLAQLFGTKKILRVMPNTPCLIGHGVNLFYAMKEFRDNKNLFHNLNNWFKKTGLVVNLHSDKSLDEITLISGSGPAYVFKLAEALYDKALDLGLDSECATALVNELVYGSSKLMKMESTMSYSEQINKVSSKGGVTAKAIEYLEKTGFNNSISKAVNSGIKHYEDLSKI